MWVQMMRALYMPLNQKGYEWLLLTPTASNLPLLLTAVVAFAADCGLKRIEKRHALRVLAQFKICH